MVPRCFGMRVCVCVVFEKAKKVWGRFLRVKNHCPNGMLLCCCVSVLHHSVLSSFGFAVVLGCVFLVYNHFLLIPIPWYTTQHTHTHLFIFESPALSKEKSSLYFIPYFAPSLRLNTAFLWFLRNSIHRVWSPILLKQEDFVQSNEKRLYPPAPTI